VPVTGHTKICGIIGDPIAHTRSPAIHNAAYAACGLDWVYIAFAVPAGGAASAIDAMRALSLAGLQVTMPHKADAAASCEQLSLTAAALGAVNTVVVRDGRVVGDSTDGEGFVRALGDEGVDVASARVVLLGAGGAARAIAHALGGAGAQLTVAARRLDAATIAAGLASGAAAVVLDEVGDAISDATVVVNATPLGMAGEDPPFDPALLHDGQLVLDTVYHPVETPLLVAARACGARVANGLGMLVHQAALSFTTFTGVEAPLDAMRAAAEHVA
jgi:shikimate dehydrogenase